MGQEIDQEFFDPQDYLHYQKKCQEQLEVLKQVYADPNFGQSEMTFGAEVELSLVDAQGRPAMINDAVITSMKDDNTQTELNQYNLEYNFMPISMQGKPFSGMEKQILDAYQKINQSAQSHNSQAVMVGILPTLGVDDVQANCMTDSPRYRALSRGIKQMRGGPFKINIHGQEPLQLASDALTLEGANTSIQYHIKVKPQVCHDWYNAIQLATPVAVAISGNSPIFLQNLLWEETRIAVFKQAIECRRDESNIAWRQPNRVSFGYGWLSSAWAYSAEMVSLYEPLIPVIQNDVSAEKYPPDLFELRLHQGAIWRWNRCIYDPKDGHIRIEMRSLPSGPSVKDMMANGAFLIGLAAYLKSKMEAILPAFPFMFAEYNFYRAAQKGFDANLLWPNETGCSPQEYSAQSLAQSLLPLAYEGLSVLGIEEKEIQEWLAIIDQRIKSQQTGSQWMRQTLALEPSHDRPEALQAMLKKYIKHMASNQPVANWALA